jgi:amino acid adenylation domain-containing protein
VARRITHLSPEQQAIRDKCLHPTGTPVEFTKEEIEQSIAGRFEKIARRYPDRTAVKVKNRELSYHELNRAANRAAGRIFSELGDAPEPVAVLFEHGIQAIIAILALLKAGKIFVALDPSSPRERTAHILEDCGVRFILTNPANADSANDLSGNTRRLLDLDNLNDSMPAADLGIGVPPDALSHILYTSGSTGKPKGVMQTHRNTLQEVMAYANNFHICPEDGMTLLASCGSGQGIKNALCALLNGARLCPLEIKTEGVGALAGHLMREEITVYHSSASLFRHFAKTLTGAETFPRLRLIRLASQQVLKEDVALYQKYFPPDCILVNALATSETGSFRWHFMNKETAVDGGVVPVGYAMEAKQVLLLDDEGRELGFDQVGEIAVKSRYLSPGYWRRPDLTQSKLLPGSGGWDERIYLTGDLGRMAPDGCLIHLGRKDFMVKIRGYRVEPSEIESALLEHESVKEAGVVACDREPDDKVLVAYVVPRQNPPPAIDELYDFLRAKLPQYMMPSAFVFLESLPLTNGKLDRSVLPPPGHERPGMSQPYVPARSEVEKELVRIWEEVLDVAPIGTHDNFFDLGGHSLLASGFLSRLHDAFNVELPLRTVFDIPTVAGLAECVETAARVRQSPRVPVVVPVPRREDLPLSFSQERLWFLGQLEPGSCAYNLCSAFKLIGVLDFEALERSFNEIVRRHESLRTVFKSVLGRPGQTILSTLIIKLRVVDFQHMASDADRDLEVCRIAEAEALRPFDLAEGPLLRITLLRLTRNEHILILTMHHIVFDGWSMAVLARELSALYEDFSSGRPSSLAELSIQYADFVSWQRDWLRGDLLEKQIAYWKTRLGNLPTLRLPTDRPRPPAQTVRGARRSFVLSQALVAGLKRVGNEHGVTLFMTLLAAYQVLLHRRAGQDDIVIGSPVAGRSRREFDGLIGFFLNMLVLRGDLSGNPTFRELLAKTRENCLAAYEHQDLPFEKLVQELHPRRDLSRNPLFQVTFALQNNPTTDFRLAGLTVEDADIGSGIAPFDLHLFIVEEEKRLRGWLAYKTDLFDASTVERWVGDFKTILEAIVADPQQRLSQVSLMKESERHQEPPLQHIPRSGDLPLSFSQQRLWFIDQLEPGSALYNASRAFRIGGTLKVEALERSLIEIARRHEVLRSTFAMAEGRPRQTISPAPVLTLPVVDLADCPDNRIEEEALRRVNEEARRPFDLACGPLLRATLFRLADEDHILVLNTHHIVSDGWSFGVLYRELSALYDAFSKGRTSPLPDLSIQYVDFAYWQRRWLRGDLLESQLRYWKRQLEGISTLDLPTDRRRPAVQSHCGARQSIILPGDLKEALKALSRNERATLFMTLLAAFNILLHRYTGREDIVVGTPIAGRNRVETEGLIGFFVNTLVLRTNLSGDCSFRELLNRTRDAALEAYEHQDLPFEKLVEELEPERNLNRSPLVQVVLAFHNEPELAAKLSGLSLAPIEIESNLAKFDLTFHLRVIPQGLEVASEYDTDLFDKETIARMLGHLQTLLEGIVADPERRLSRLPLLTEAEQRRLLVEWNDAGIDYSQDKCIHELFEAQVERSPEAVAVVFEHQQLTYRELDRRANQLAGRLQKMGVGPEILVGLYMERCAEIVVAILAVLKAGGAYVPIDPSYPRERVAFLLGDSGVRIVLTQDHLLSSLPANGIRAVSLTDSVQLAEPGPETAPVSGAAPDNLAYVIYTSGSTGKPKGSLITHENVTRLFAATDSLFKFAQNDVWTLFHSYAFDFSVWEIWGALLNGGRLVVVPYWTSRSPQTFYDLLCQERVTVLNQTPSAFKQLIAAEPPRGDPRQLALRLVIFGGEALHPECLSPWFDRHGDRRPEMINMYGITETTVHVTYRAVREADLCAGKGSLIGKPIPDLKFYILDAHQNPVPIGVPGEVCVGGAGLARGYIDRAELTAEQFIPNPFSALPGDRLYRSGDLARRLSGGDIEYLGRIDAQVKIRGFRIEPGEIESALAQHPAVREVTVVAREEAGEEAENLKSDKRLVAYMVPRHDAAPISDLRNFLKRKLPEYMIPSAFVFLDSLPLTPNGKIDRRALPDPDEGRPELQRAFLAPRTRTEDLLAKTWAEVLELEKVGVYDNFFELGGHSLSATQVIARLRDTLHVELPLRSLFESPTVAGLAERVEEFRTVGETTGDTEEIKL